MPPASIWVILAQDGVDENVRPICYTTTEADAERAVELLGIAQKSGAAISLDPKMVPTPPGDRTGAVGSHYWHDTAKFYSRNQV